MTTETAAPPADNTAPEDVDSDQPDDACPAVDEQPIDVSEQTTSNLGRSKRLTRRLAGRWRSIAVTSLMLACAGTAGATYLTTYRSDRASAEATTQVAKAASEGAVALLSYAPASLDHDLAAARSHLTGGFLTYYSQFADQFVAPAAKQKDIHAVASVVRAATIDAHADSAHVLIFLNQTTTSRENPEPTQSASSVNVGLTKIDGVWRISSFDPI
ncbi:Twin-arginine translocation pathway signal [Mycobacteroides abscessus subsp. abscessus]|nr:Twin-arginine translocation pathway signal [Mycobacteroides abscessus subsp. abscessus]